MDLSERWWRVVNARGSSIWVDHDPDDMLVAAWADATVSGPFVLESSPTRGAVEDDGALLRELTDLIYEGFPDVPDNRNELRPLVLRVIEVVRAHTNRGAVGDREALIEDAMHEINVRWHEDEDAPLAEALVRETAEAIIDHCLRGAVE